MDYQEFKLQNKNWSGYWGPVVSINYYLVYFNIII